MIEDSHSVQTCATLHRRQLCNSELPVYIPEVSVFISVSRFTWEVVGNELEHLLW